MSRVAFYEIVYHRNDWQLADAFKPQPGWGRRRFTTAVAAMGDCSEQEVLDQAHKSAPVGHRLTSLSVYPTDGAERVIWSTPADKRFAATTEALDTQSRAAAPNGSSGEREGDVPHINQARDDAPKEIK